MMMMMSEKESCEIEVWPYLQNLTSNVISRSAFGINFEEEKLIFDLLKELNLLLVKMALSIYFPGLR